MYVTEYLESRRVPFKPLLHTPAFAATRRAGGMHVPGGRVAKAVLVRVGESFAIAVLASTRRIDLELLSEAAGCPPADTRLATDRELEDVFSDCELGVVPPFGQLYGLRTFVDSDLAADGELITSGNMRHEGVRIQYQDFEAVTAPVRASFSHAVAARQPRLKHTKPDRLAS
jgi:Ala-tRNA(Pro) deacylase